MYMCASIQTATMHILHRPGLSVDRCLGDRIRLSTPGGTPDAPGPPERGCALSGNLRLVLSIPRYSAKTKLCKIVSRGGPGAEIARTFLLGNLGPQTSSGHKFCAI